MTPRNPFKDRGKFSTGMWRCTNVLQVLPNMQQRQNHIVCPKDTVRQHTTAPLSTLGVRKNVLVPFPRITKGPGGIVLCNADQSSEVLVVGMTIVTTDNSPPFPTTTTAPWHARLDPQSRVSSAT